MVYFINKKWCFLVPLKLLRFLLTDIQACIMVYVTMMTNRTFRLASEVVEQILTIAEAEKCSQGEVIAKAINLYNERSDMYPTPTKSETEGDGDEIL